MAYFPETIFYQKLCPFIKERNKITSEYGLAIVKKA